MRYALQQVLGFPHLSPGLGLVSKVNASCDFRCVLLLELNRSNFLKSASDDLVGRKTKHTSV